MKGTLSTMVRGRFFIHSGGSMIRSSLMGRSAADRWGRRAAGNDASPAGKPGVWRLTRILALAALAVLPAALLSGCGSGGSATAPASTAQFGRATFVIQWPTAKGRLIPDATQSIKLDILKGSNTVRTTLVNRTPGQSTVTVTLPNLPVGTLTIVATAFAQPNAQGNPVASGTATLNIQQNMNTTATLTMNSTVDHFDIVSSSGSFNIVTNQVIQLMVTARDKLGNAVMVAPSALQFTSSNPAVAAVSALLDANGNPTGFISVKGGSIPGTAQITITDFESNTTVATGAVGVTVAAAMGPTNTRFVYVANRTAGTISVYKADPATGALTASGGPAQAGVNPQSVVVDPSGRFVYVANQGSGAARPGTITGYTVDEISGALQPLPGLSGNPYSAGTKPTALAAVAIGTQEFLYSVDSFAHDILIFSIDPGSGTLSPTGTAVDTGGINPMSITISPNGQFAYVTNAGDGVNPGSISAFMVNSGGALGLIGTVPAGVNAESAAVSPGGGFVYVANIGDNTVSAYRVEAATGALTALATATDPAAKGPYALAVAGNFVYVANRDSNNVSIFAIDPKTGMLTLAASSPVAAGTAPESIALDATGTVLYVGNLVSNNVTEYSINPSTGVITVIGAAPVAAGTGPAAIATTRGATGNVTVTAQ